MVSSLISAAAGWKTLSAPAIVKPVNGPSFGDQAAAEMSERQDGPAAGRMHRLEDRSEYSSASP